MASETSPEIVSAYAERYEVQKLFTENVHELIKIILNQEGIGIATSESRTKSHESLSEKIDRPEKVGKYKHLEDITDLSGIRLVLYIREDCDKVDQIIRKHFKIDRKNSTNKNKPIDLDRFGYTSNHIVISYKDNRTKLPEFEKFVGMKAEVQIRTLLQHTWAAIDWRMRYKSKTEVPTELQRNLYSLSALLEVADTQFSALEDQAASIRNDYREKIDTGDLDIEINADSVSIFMDKNKSWSKLLSEARDSGLNVKEVDFPKEKRTAYVVDFLKHEKISSVGELERKISSFDGEFMNQLKELNRLWAEREGKVAYSPEGLLRVVLLLDPESKAPEKSIDAVNLNYKLKNVIRGLRGIPEKENQ